MVEIGMRRAWHCPSRHVYVGFVGLVLGLASCGVKTASVIKSNDVAGSDLTRSNLTQSNLSLPPSLDYSTAGYANGDNDIPGPNKLGPCVTVAPSGGDDAAALQAAIDQVSQRPLSATGFRGRVCLQSGTYTLASSLSINASGVVLAGSRTGQSVLQTAPNSPVEKGAATMLLVGNKLKMRTYGNQYWLKNTMVPLGARQLPMQSTAGINVGDPVRVTGYHNAAWIAMLGMDNLGKDANGNIKHWDPGVYGFTRTVVDVRPDSIVLDAGLAEPIIPDYSSPYGTNVTKVDQSTFIVRVGIQDLTAKTVMQPGGNIMPQPRFVGMDNVTDAWVANVQAYDFGNTAYIGGGARRITLDQVVAHRLQHNEVSAGGGMSDYLIEGTQVWLKDCSSDNQEPGVRSAPFFVATGRAVGPVVVQHFTATGHGQIQPHMHHATGLLFDQCFLDPNSTTSFVMYNRGGAGSGHGWAQAYSMIWGGGAAKILAYQPRNEPNWVVNVKGEPTAPGRSWNGDPTCKQHANDPTYCFKNVNCLCLATQLVINPENSTKSLMTQQRQVRLGRP